MVAMDIMDKREQYKRVFADFDSDGDGKISCSELRLCVGGDSLTEEEAEAAVRFSDSDGDGMLDLEDFVSLVEAGNEDEKVQDLREAFKMYATAPEKNGKSSMAAITPKSLKRMLSRLGMRRSTVECGVMIAEFDVNKDGVLDFEEFKVMMS